MNKTQWEQNNQITEYRIHPEIKDFKRTSQHRNKESEDKMNDMNPTKTLMRTQMLRS